MGTILKYNTNFPHPNDLGNALLHFREMGYTVASNIFEPASVDAYREMLWSRVKPSTESIWRPLVMDQDSPQLLEPILAPKLRQVLKGCLSQTIYDPAPALLAWGYNATPANPESRLVHDWHKDADHRCLSNVNGYQAPNLVNVAMYFEDVTPDHGPTYVIPRSHLDPEISPHAGAKEIPFLPKKGDAMVWDARLWHRASVRKIEGYRIFAGFLFFGMGDPFQRKMPAAQRQAAMEQTDPELKLLLGGPYELAS